MRPVTVRRASSVLAVLGAVALLAGCTNAPPPTAERSKFAIAADKICTELTDTVKPLRDDATRAVENDELTKAADFTRRAADSAVTYLDQLDKLEPPSEDQKGVDEWIGRLRQQQAKTKEIATAIERRDPDGAKDANDEIRDLAAKTRRFAFDFGMQSCSK